MCIFIPCENNNLLQIMPLPVINLESLIATGGKPKDYYLLEFFRLYERYWDAVLTSGGNEFVIDASTGLLLGTCTSKMERERLWNNYITIKKTKGKTTLDASILTIGDLWDFLNEKMEFTECAYLST